MKGKKYEFEFSWQQPKIFGRGEGAEQLERFMKINSNFYKYGCLMSVCLKNHDFAKTF